MMASTAWYYGWWLLSPGYKIIVRAPQIIWGVLIKTWHFQGYFTPWTAGAELAWLGWLTQLPWLLVFYLILCLLSLWTRQKPWNEGMLASLGNSWHFVETHKHPPEDPLYCIEAKQRIRTNKSGAHEPLSLSLSQHLQVTTWARLALGPLPQGADLQWGFCKHSYLAKTLSQNS